MTDIDVPDWVVDIATEAYSALPARTTFHDSMQAAFRAALSAWVAPVAKIGTCAEVKWLQGGPCQLPPKEVLYTFLQEKPE